MGKAVADVVAAGVDAAARDAPVRQAGRAGGRGPDRPARDGGPAGRATTRPAPGARREPRLPHLGRRCRPARSAQEMLAARVSLVAGAPGGEEVLGQGLVLAEWTDDEALSTRINPQVAHYTGQAELADAIQEGLEARKRRRRRHRDGQARPGGRAGRRVRQRGHRQAAGQGGRRGGRGDRHRPAEEEGRRRRRDGARHPVDQDGEDQEAAGHMTGKHRSGQAGDQLGDQLHRGGGEGDADLSGRSHIGEQ